MAIVENNLFLYGLRGKIGGQIVIRQTKNGTVVAVPPRSTAGRELSPAEANQRERFRLGVMYGKGAKDRPEYKEAATSRKISGFNVATADFLHPPEIPEINLAQYGGRQGDPVFVRAFDDVEVDRVGIMIVGDNNTLVEQGSMTRDVNDKTLWRYAATVDAAVPHVQVIVDAADLASQVTTETAQKDL